MYVKFNVKGKLTDRVFLGEISKGCFLVKEDD